MYLSTVLFNCFQGVWPLYSLHDFESYRFWGQEIGEIDPASASSMAAGFFEKKFGEMHMPNFELYVDRHGEGWVQHLVEMIERKEGIRYGVAVPLEERWNALMHGGCAMPQRMAA